MAEQNNLPPKGKRTVDIAIIDGKIFGGLGEDLAGQDRAKLTQAYGEVDRAIVKDLIDTLQIGAIDSDYASLCYDIDTIRITDHRAVSALDNLFAEVNKMAEHLPVGQPNYPPALMELAASNSRRQSVEVLARIEVLRVAMQSLALANEAVRTARLWESMTLDWRDDAFLLAMTLRVIAERSGVAQRLSFKSSNGPATKAIAVLLNLAGHRIRKQPVRADTVRNGLRDHPQAEILGLN